LPQKRPGVAGAADAVTRWRISDGKISNAIGEKRGRMAGTGNVEVDRYLNQTLANLQRLTEVQRQLAELRGEGFGADGLVRAEVGPGGNLQALDLNPRAMRLDSASLSEAIMAAVRDATRQVGEKATELVGDLTGDGDRTAMADLFAGRVPQPGPAAGDAERGADAVGRSDDPVGEAIRRLRGTLGR
jgi:DNA-binding protein YbaB